jgi:hypothetical protein
VVKAYYLSGPHPAPLAGGAVIAGISAERCRWTWQGAAVMAFLAVGGAAWMALSLPILLPPEFARFRRLMEFNKPQMYKALARVYFSIRESEPRTKAIHGNTYTQAEAIDCYGPGLGLLKAIIGHQSYEPWKPRHYTGGTMILIGISKQGAKKGFMLKGVLM